MPYSRKILAVLVGLCLSSKILTVQAADPAKELSFITIETAPWASFDADTGKPIGAFPAIINEIGKRSDLKITMSFRPFARINQGLVTGNQDCTIILWNNSRRESVERGATVYDMPFGVVAKTGFPLKSYSDLEPLTISMLRGLKMDPKFDSDQSLHRDFDKSYEIGLRKMAHNRLDAIAGAMPTIFYMADQKHEEKLLGDYLVLKEIPIAFQCSKKSPKLGLMPEVNRVIEEVRSDGTLQRLLAENFYF